MTQQTLDLIHRAYQESISTSSNLMEIIQNLYNILDSYEVSEEDSQAFDTFIDGLRGSIQFRKKTFQITNLTTYLNITMMYIVLWLNKTKNMHIDINWYARRKALESELTKLLDKSNSSLSASIRDRFGIRGIVLNDIDEEEVKNFIYTIFEAIVGIIAAKNRKARKEFYDWIDANPNIDLPDKILVKHVLEIPFSIDFIKDYIKTPKPNNYQSIQFTVSIPVYSSVLPGCQIEIQLRSLKMHEIAEKGSASHLKYKENGGVSEEEVTEQDKAIRKVFIVDDFSKLHIVGFTSYASREDDRDGIHFAKEFSDRRISTTLVPE